MEEAYKQLIDRLTEACAEQDHFMSRVHVVMATRDFLQALNVPSSLTKPLNDVIVALIDIQTLEEHGNKPGPKPKSFKEQTKVAFAAAIVSALRACDWSVDAAIREVCKATNFDRKWLRQLRDNLHRGKGDPVTLDHYDDYLEELGQVPQDRLEGEALLHLKNLSRW